MSQAWTLEVVRFPASTALHAKDVFFVGKKRVSLNTFNINFEESQLFTLYFNGYFDILSIMSKPNQPEKPRAAPIFRPPLTPAPLNPIPSSSPAFATPVHPIRPFNAAPIPTKATILPIILPPATLRPLAFRTFTKKHSLTLTSSALQVLATFIGRHCGTEWREEGLAERVLEEVAKSWKNRNGGVIVEGDGSELKDILKNLEGSMSGGRIVASRELSRQNSLVLGPSQNGEASHTRLGIRPSLLGREDSQSSLGMSTLDMDDDEEEGQNDPRKWLKVIDAFEQPRLIYNVGKKHFDRFVLV
jgi:DNA polymerase epsilon subunit 2